MSGSAEKSEEPTPKKLRDARDKGQVANSKEVVSAAVIIIVILMIVFGFGWAVDNLLSLMGLVSSSYSQPFDEALVTLSYTAFDVFVKLAISFSVIAAVTAIVANYLQIGPLLSFDPIIPKYEKIDIVAGFKRIFCLKNFIEFVKSVLKVIFLGVACFFVIRSNIYDIVKIPVCGERCIFSVLGFLLFQLMLVTVIFFIFVAGLDLLFQNYSHKKDLRMTKDEVKREHKDTDGNPLIKSRRRQIHREVLEGQGLSTAVEKSNVVVTNPVEVAVAVDCNKEGDQFRPKVNAKGVNLRAKKIKAYAAEYNVPIMENVDLAREIYDRCDEYRLVKPEVFQTLIQVILWLDEYRVEQGLESLLN